MNSSPLKWGDIVSSVERAHLEDSKNLRLRQKKINQKYVEDADEQMKRRRLEEAHKRMLEMEERLIIEEQYRREQQIARMSKEQRKKKERSYEKDNLQIMQTFKNTEKKELNYSQHPFSSLIDQSDKRRERFREKLRRQNEINTIQEKIKQQQRRQKQLQEKQQRQKYVNHIEAFYLKKIEDRNTFKNKYLKISSPQRSHLLLSSKTHENIQKNYETLNQQLMKTNKMKDPYVDNVLSSINKHIDLPDSSPAYLGRIPISSDRKRQLDYLEKSAYRSPIEKKRLKTQGDIYNQIQFDARRYTTNAHQLPALENYYKNISIDKERRDRHQSKRDKTFCGNQFQANHSSFVRNTTNELRIKQLTYNNTHQNNTKDQHRSQNSTNTAKKVFSTYDIIQNKRKYVCI